jgi:methionine aminopeptidase
MINKISEDQWNKYKQGEQICKKVIIELLEKMKLKEILSVKELENFADNRIQEECEMLKKKKFVVFPTSISLNNCVGNYLYDESKELEEYNYIKNNDIVKIELGVNISGCIINVGETVIYSDNEELDKLLYEKHGKYLELLELLKVDILENIKDGETNDEIRINIESKCTDYGCFPIKNCISYQHLDGQIKTDESKYIICNFINNDNVNDINDLDNLCFEFEEGEIYTINLQIIPNDNNNDDETKHKYYKLEKSHIYRFNDNNYDLKLKSARDFRLFITKKYKTNPFNYLKYRDNTTYKLGIRECLKSNILEEYPILYSKDKLPIYTKKFTIYVGKDKAMTFN